MLTLTRKVGERTYLQDELSGWARCITILSLREGTAEIEVRDPLSREVENVHRLEFNGQNFDTGAVTVYYNRLEDRNKIRLAFDAPRNIIIERDNMKTRPQAAGSKAA